LVQNKGMSDVYTLGMIAGVVAVVAFVLYVWDRTSKNQEIEWLDAGKLAMGAGGVAGGVAYAVGSDGVDAVVESATSAASAAQDMFVGKPGF
jgi:hypothetical protein